MMVAAVPVRSAPPPWRVPRPGRVVRGLRARRRPSPIPSTTLAAVLDRYGVRATGRDGALAIGWRSDNVVADTTAGTVVVKRYPVRAVPETIRHEHSIAGHLAGQGFPVAPLWRTAEGRTHCAVGGRSFAVSGYVAGVSLTGCYLPPARKRALFRHAGALLATFHDALEGFEPAGHHHLGLGQAYRGDRDDGDTWNDRADPEPYLATLAELRDAAAPSGDPRQRWLADRAVGMGEAIRDLDRRLREHDVAVGVIHGDFGLHNLTYARDGSPTLHDLELARIDRVLIDVVTVLSRTTMSCGRSFLAGYDAVRTIDRGDWEVLPLLWQHYRLCGAVRSWRNHRDHGGDHRLDAARARVEEAVRVAGEGVSPWA